MTLVNNLELYGIDLIKFSKECQHGVAASTTINDVPNAQNRQVQIQGSQVLFVFKLLTGKCFFKIYHLFSFLVLIKCMLKKDKHVQCDIS